MNKIPRNKENDYTREAAAERRAFAKEQRNVELEHVGGFSFDPSVLPGNVENFIGVAQIPIGLAGPLLVNGEYAQGEFFVPLATVVIAPVIINILLTHIFVTGDGIPFAVVLVFANIFLAYANWDKYRPMLAA